MGRRRLSPDGPTTSPLLSDGDRLLIRRACPGRRRPRRGPSASECSTDDDSVSSEFSSNDASSEHVLGRRDDDALRPSGRRRPFHFRMTEFPSDASSSEHVLGRRDDAAASRDAVRDRRCDAVLARGPSASECSAADASVSSECTSDGASSECVLG